MSEQQIKVMNAKQLENPKPENWMPKVLIIGGVLGALAGLGAAYLLVQRAEQEGKPPEITPGEGIKLGLLVLGLLRSVATLGEGK